MSALWTIAANPKRRRARKGRSAAQKAATRRMLAANRARRNPVRRKRRSTASAAAPRARRITRRSARRFVARVRASFAGIGGGAIGLVKAGAIGAGGALAVDVAMGFANGFLPATMATKLNADGTTNYLNYAVKGTIAVGLAHFGGRFVPRHIAHQMATGSMTVMAYELMRPMVAGILPASMPLGYYSPAPKFSAAPGMGNYQSTRLGNYQNTSRVVPLRSPNDLTAARR